RRGGSLVVSVPMELIKQLRELSGAGMMDCKNALEEAAGDINKAFTILREKGIAKASKRAGRATGQGVVESYLHSPTPDFPPQVIPRIVEGQIEVFLKQSCLLEQEYFREPGHTVHEFIAENISKLQENITVRRFARFNIRET